MVAGLLLAISFWFYWDLDIDVWLFMKANDQLRRWFEDDDALERAINGEYV